MFVSKNFKTFVQEDKATDDKVTMLEARVKHRDDPESFYKTLVPESDVEKYFRLLDLLRETPGTQSLPQVEQYWTQTERRSNSGPLRHEVYFKYLVSRLSAETDPKLRQPLLEELNKHYLSERLRVPQVVSSAKAGIQNPSQDSGKSSSTPVDFNQELVKKISHSQSSIKELQNSRLHGEVLLNFPHTGLFKTATSKEEVDWYLRQILPNPGLTQEAFRSVFRCYVDSISKWVRTYQIPTFLMEGSTADQLEAIIPFIDPLPQVVLTEWLWKKFELASIPEGDIPSREALDGINKALASLPPSVKASQSVLQTAAWVSLLILFPPTSNPAPAELAAVLTHLSTHPQVLPITSQPWHQPALNKGGRLHEQVVECMFPAPQSIVADTLQRLHDTFVAHAAAEATQIEAYFEAKSLKKAVAKSQLLAGHAVEDVALLFSEIELNTLRDSRVLEFAKSNSTSFKKGQSVKISVDLKNIRSLQISLFTLNTANCHAAGRDLDRNIDLSGLIPSEQRTEKYAQPAMHRHREVFDFPTVAAADRGLFVVELVGEGLCSRTIIKKGGLSLVPISENTCHRFVVLAEDGQVCPNSKIEVVGRHFSADSAGIVDIPFSTRGLTGSGVISYGGFYEPFSLQIPPINWNLDFGTVYNEEAVCGGGSLDLIIRPRVFANNIPTSLSVLSKVQLLVSSATSENILSARHFDPTLDNLEEILLSYQIPLKTVWIKVALTAEIDGIVVTLAKSLKSVQPSELNRTLSVFLDKSTNDSYVLVAKGLSGEPVPQLEIQAEMTPHFTTEIRKEKYTTDSEGKVLLGQLSSVVKLKITYQDSGSSMEQEFPLVSDTRFSGIPDELDIAEGEDLRLPKLRDSPDIQYLLVRTDSKFTNNLSDCSKNIEYEGDVFYCTKLRAGHYLFKAIHGTTIKLIKITVISGKRWENSSEIVLTHNSAHRLQHQSNYLTIYPVPMEIKNHELSFKVYSNQNEIVKVNVLGFQSCPNTLGDIIESLNKLTVRAKHTVYPLRQDCNLYLSEREVGDELKYVVERQQRATFPGNNLEKPSGLLKPQFNSKTQVDTQKTATAAYFKTSFGELPAPQHVEVPSVTRPTPSTSWKNQFLNNKWLAERGKIASAEPDIEGTVTLNCSSLVGYSCWVILVQDGNNFVYQLYYPPRNTLSPKSGLNLGLPTSRNAGSVYLHSRVSGVLAQSQSVTFGGISSISHNTLRSFNHFFDLCLAFQPELLQFGFLKEWSSLSLEEKQQQYEKLAGHELHLFIKEKDAQLHQKLVVPHLKNKLKPSVIDLCVLDSDLLTATEHASGQRLATLAPWEVTLLARHFKKRGDTTTHKKLVEYLRLKAAGVESNKQQVYKTQFDTVVNFSAAKTGTSGSDDALTAGSASLQGKDGRLYDTRADQAAPKSHTSSTQPTKNSSSVYIEVGKTYEYSEREYYLESKVNHSDCAFGFWADMAESDPQPGSQALLSEKFIRGRSQSTLETLMFCIFQGFTLEDSAAADTLDLEIEKKPNQTSLRNPAKSPCLYFVKELIEKKEEARQNPESSNVFISYTYTPQNATSREQSSCANEGLLQTRVVYTCKVVVVSTSANQMDLELQAEVPQGAIPVKSDNYFHSKPFSLSKYGNFTFEYSFYFPYEGQFSVFPPTLLSNGDLLKTAALIANKQQLKVVNTLPRAEITTAQCSLEDLVKQVQDTKGAIIQEAFTQLKPTILEQLQTLNPFDIPSSDIRLLAPMVALDKAFFIQVITILRQRGIFEKELWAFCILHDVEQSLREYLEYRFPESQTISMKDFEIYYFKTKLLRVNGFKSMTYDPVVNSRSHFMEGRSHSITNKQFLDTYMYFLKYLQDKHNLDDSDRFQFAEYLIVQDRIAEANEELSKIQQPSDGSKVQYDYLRVYCLMCQLSPPIQTILDICSKYFEYPVVSWRNLFVEAANVLTEHTKGTTSTQQVSSTELEGSTAYKNAKNALLQETLKATVTDSKIVISSTNLKKVTLNFYKVDVETKFSTDPFSRQTDSTFGFVAPNLSKEVAISEGAANEVTQTESAIPAELSAFNLCVQVFSESKSVFLNYLPSSYQVVTFKERGLLQVLNKKGQPVSQAYVKVFSSATNGTEKYHKDGYTDYLGFFDYLTLNLENPSNIKEFSILILGPPTDPGSQILRASNSLKDKPAAKGSRQEDLIVEQKLRSLQSNLAGLLQSTQQTQISPSTGGQQKASKYAIVLN